VLWNAGTGHSHAVSVPVRVLLVDDRCDFRSLARALLAQRGYAVVGEAASGPAALSAAARLQPDAVMLEVEIADGEGFEVARAPNQVCPGASVLLVSVRDYGACEELVRGAGAAGFLLKSQLATADLGDYWPDD
jgi:DNA-binding NarL/FixJ family response regulator